MRLPYANMITRYWNPGATMPLILPVHVICNTPDEDIHNNIRINSRTQKDWVSSVDPHDGVAVLCGSGPSLADHLDDIRQHVAAGHKIFAMNGSAEFLADRGIFPDFQVLIDARAETAQLVGPAREHLFASQVHPDCFKKVPYARLWHLGLEGIDDLLPPDSGMLSLIGGSASVGNTATCLAYAMGYRNLQIYGYDSCHREGNGHAFHQKMNDGDPTCVVTFGGKDYTCSLTMKLQAEVFQSTARSLIEMGCKVEVHGDGLLQDMFKAPVEVLEEAKKYERMWEHAQYRKDSPGEGLVDTFIDKVEPQGLVIDFGCGTGRAAARMKAKGLTVQLIDFAENCLDEENKGLPFLKWDLCEPMCFGADYGFCTDVLEHIPPTDVEKVIRNIMIAANTVFFQVSTVPDNMGVLIKEYLHLTVRPFQWWHDLFVRLGFKVDWWERHEHASMFIVKNTGERQ